MKTHDTPAETLKKAFRREAECHRLSPGPEPQVGMMVALPVKLSSSPRLAGTEAWLQREMRFDA